MMDSISPEMKAKINAFMFNLLLVRVSNNSRKETNKPAHTFMSFFYLATDSEARGIKHVWAGILPSRIIKSLLMFS